MSTNQGPDGPQTTRRSFVAFVGLAAGATAAGKLADLVAPESAFAADGTYAMLLPERSPSVWNAQNLDCQDGVRGTFISSWPAGESATGVIHSKTFNAPTSLSFWLAGASDQNANFALLVDNTTGEALRSEPPPRTHIAKKITWDLSDLGGRSVQFVIKDADDKSGYAWIAVGRLAPAVVAMPGKEGACEPFAQGPCGTIPPDWTAEDSGPVLTDGIPFRQGTFWPVGAPEGGNLDIAMGDARASWLYLLGGYQLIPPYPVDYAYLGWGGQGENSKVFFVGDEVGSLRVNYNGAETDKIPLVLGHNVWWRYPYQVAPEPFNTETAAMNLLDRSLFVANGAEGYQGSKPYYVRIQVRDLPISSITFRDTDAKRGHLEVDGVTLGGVLQQPANDPPVFESHPGGDIPAERARWLDEHTVSAVSPLPPNQRQALTALASSLYTFPRDITGDAIEKTSPEFTESNFAGPKVSFRGSAEAQILTNVYFENAHEVVSRVDPETGVVSESNPHSDTYAGFGGRKSDVGPYKGLAFTRSRGQLHYLSHAGFTHLTEKALDYFDSAMMRFPQTYPKLQYGGKPIPAHATTVANDPAIGPFPETALTPYPFPPQFGNPENDGHGMLMLAHYRAWLKSGRDESWVQARWPALEGAAEYLPWCLDNPDLSFAKHDLPFSYTEGGYAQSMYCDVPCTLGLLGFAQMADAIGRNDNATRWRSYAERLFDAMDSFYQLDSQEWGRVWDPAKSGGWEDGPGANPQQPFKYLQGEGHATLAPLLFGMDFYGYDVLPNLRPGWAEITRNTYRRQLTRNETPYAAVQAMGYGHSYITQAALLLDQMSDAEEMIRWLARLCFAPRLPSPYRAPEAASINEFGSMWRRQGDLGNLYQTGEVVWTITTMLGIDDTPADHTKLMPRLPSGWDVTVKDWPVSARVANSTASVNVAFDIKRNTAGTRFDLALTTDKPVDHWRVRLGPFPRGSRSMQIILDGKTTTVAPTPSGDAAWAWIDIHDGTQHRVRAVAS